MKRRKTRGRKRPANKVEPFGYDPTNPLTLYFHRVCGNSISQKNPTKKTAIFEICKIPNFSDRFFFEQKKFDEKKKKIADNS